MAAEWCGVTCCGATPLASPVLEQEGPEHVGTVLCLDLVGDDHLLHHLMRDAWEGLLVQIKEHGTWGNRTKEATSRYGSANGYYYITNEAGNVYLLC